MTNIEKTLDALQPYVIGIRFLKTQPVVDIVLNEGWTLPEDVNIIRTKGDESMNYHMIHSDVDGIGLDKLLEYVEKTIKINLEREKKHDLLKDKVNQLKEVFKKNSLDKLQRLKFTFGDEDFVGDMSDIDVEINELIEPKNLNNQSNPQTITQEIKEEIVHNKTSEFLDEEGKPIELTDEDIELAAEEERAKQNLKIIANRKQNKSPNQNLAKQIELPPKRKLALANNECDCDENEACDKCIDSKGY